MADWFEQTNNQQAFAETALTRTVLHGQAEKGNPLSKDSFIIAVSKRPHEDCVDFFKTAKDAEFLDITDSFSATFNKLADPKNHMWMINVIKKQDMGDNDTNSQIPYVHVHLLSGDITEKNAHIETQRTFHPHGKSDIYDLFRENKQDMTKIDKGSGVFVYPLPEGKREAKEHFAIVHEGYKSFSEFTQKATKEEKLAFWKAAQELVVTLAERHKGARMGEYNLRGVLDEKIGHMYVEVVGGENLGYGGKPNRWFQKPATAKP